MSLVKCVLFKPSEFHRVCLVTLEGEHCPVFQTLGHRAEEVWGELLPLTQKVVPEGLKHPEKCRCGHVFTQDAHRCASWHPVWTDGQRMVTTREMPPGAVYDADWMHGWAENCGPDGRSICAILPNGAYWCIDSRATNCDSPCKHCQKPFHQHIRAGGIPTCPGYEDAKPHKCWIRHGEPPNLTVDKNGVTCGAGAGSIAVTGWHGFLSGGVFRPC